MFVGCPRGWSSPGYRPRPARSVTLAPRSVGKKYTPSATSRVGNCDRGTNTYSWQRTGVAVRRNK
eukprot:971051-Pyramimonas_sp.AAC.1